MNRTLEDLATLPPKKLVRRLEELADAALPCVAVNVFDGNPTDGLTVGLWADPGDRRDVLDLARVVETEPGGWAVVAWATLCPSERGREWTLLLRVEFRRPVRCEFDVRIEVPPDNHPTQRLVSLLAAADRFVVSFAGLPGEAERMIVVPAPASHAFADLG